ncbi:MAG: hypothetical protein EAZ55_07900 [Cytophagales bacterium]|nr:MAG: hypothetical protein EAZ55_07900 [Cytophagales bacterium]
MNTPIEILLDEKLIELLKSLSPAEWEMQTVATRWKVKDVAAHLLDGNLRGLSTSRDAFFGEKPTHINSHQDLVDFLNQLNLTWTNAARRLSPQVIIELLRTTNEAYSNHLKTLNPSENAVFPVAWAGQNTSPNWLHIAREYTEKFLHQQQIRDAVKKEGIMTKELYYPFIDTLMFAFAPTFKDTAAAIGTVVSLEISTEIGGIWHIIKTNTAWELYKNIPMNSHAKVIIAPEHAWKLFSKSWKPEQVLPKIEIIGDTILAKQVLTIVAVMA